jgi:hypothetical protein
MQFAVPVEFRQQTSFYSNSGLSFDINRYDVANRSFIECFNLWKPRNTCSKGYLYFAMLLLTSKVLNMKMTK